MSVRDQVAKWAPGPKSTGAIAEITGWNWDYVSNTRWGIDGETALRAWNKGKCSVEQGVAAAKACRDGAALAAIIKDRRVAVRVAVLSNSLCPWEILTDKATYRGRAGQNSESYTVQRVARETLPKAAAAKSFTQAWAQLRDGQQSASYKTVAEHPKLRDEHIDMVVESSFVGSDGKNVNGATVVAEHGRFTALSGESLIKLLEAADGDLVNLLRFIVTSSPDRDNTVLKAMSILRTKESKRSGWLFAHAKGVSAETHRLIRDWMVVECGRELDKAHMSNPESPWQLWVDADVSRPGAGDALGRAVADVWGDDADVWRLVFELLTDFKGSVREMLLWLSVYHPSTVLDDQIESA